MPRSHSRLALIVAAALALGCSDTSWAKKKEKTVPPVVAPAEPLSCRAELKVVSSSAAGVQLAATLHNEGGAPLYLLHSKHMPYVLVPKSDEVVVAYSIQPLPTDRDLGSIATLDTVEVAPHGQLQREVTLKLPLQTSSHFSSAAPYRGELAATVQVTVEFGLIGSALDPRQRHRQVYRQELAAQRLCRSPPVAVQLGAAR